MAQATNYQNTSIGSFDKKRDRLIEQYSFDNNLINMVDFISEDSDNLMKDYLIKDEIIKTKIIYFVDDKNTITDTINDNEFVISMEKREGFNDSIPDDDGGDDAYNRDEERKKLLKYINFVDYNKIERKKIQTAYNKYQALKTKIIALQLRKQKYDKSREKNFFFSIISSKLLWSSIGTGAVIGLNIAVCSNLSNPAVWIHLALQIYDNPVLFGLFIDLMNMLDIFNTTEKLELKRLFYNLKNQIDGRKNSLGEGEATGIPYENAEFMKFYFTEKISPGNVDEEMIEKFGAFIVVDPLDATKIEFLNDGELNNFTTFITTIINKKDIFNEAATPLIRDNWLSLVTSLVSSPYVHVIISSLKIGGSIYGYVDTTINVIQNVSNIDSTFMYRGVSTAIKNSDAFQNISYLLSKGTTDVGVNVINTIFGEWLLKYGDEYLSNLPFIGGIINGKNVEQVFVASISSLISAQVTGQIDGYFKPMEEEIKLAMPSDDDDSDKKNNIIDDIEFELKERVKYKKLGYTNEEICEILNPEIEENEYKNFIFKGIRYFYKTFKKYSKNPQLIASALCNCTALFNIILSLVGGRMFSLLSEYIIAGNFHYTFFEITWPIEFKLPHLMNILTTVINIITGGNPVFQNMLREVKDNFIRTFLDDLSLFISDIQNLIYNNITGNAEIKKYVDYIFSNFYFNLFKNCVTLTYNVLLIPSLNIKLNNVIQHGITEIDIIDILNDETKCRNLFLFLNHKLYNMMIGFPSNILKGNINVSELVYNFQDFFDMDKIIYNNIIPYFNLTTGYYNWENYSINNLSGAIIEIKPKDKTTQESTDVPNGKYIIVNSDLNNRQFKMISVDNLFKQLHDKDKNNILSDNDEDELFFDYYYHLFREDPTTDKNNQTSYDEFKKWLLEKKIPELKQEPNVNNIEFAIINNVAVNMSERFKETPPLNFQMDAVTVGIFDNFLSEVKHDDYKEDIVNISQQELITNMTDEITLPLEYWSMNSSGSNFTPIKFKTIDFFTVANILSGITNDENATDLVNKIADLNSEAENNPRLKYVLNILESSKKRELEGINNELVKFSNKFKADFNNNNSISLQYIGFNFENFKDKCKTKIGKKSGEEEGLDLKNSDVQKFIIEKSKINKICNDDGKKILLYNYGGGYIDANTGNPISCNDTIDINKLVDDVDLWEELLYRPTTLANIIYNTPTTLEKGWEFLFGEGPIKNFISKLNINSETLFDIIDSTLEEDLQPVAGDDEFDSQRIDCITNFKSLFKALKEKAKLDFNIKEELLKYLIDSGVKDVNGFIFDGEQQHISAVFTLASFKKETNDRTENLMKKWNSFCDKKSETTLQVFLNDIGGKIAEDIIYNEEVIPIGRKTPYYEYNSNNKNMYIMYNKKFEELRGNIQKVGDRTDLTKDNACQGEGGLGEYIDSIKDFYETQEKMRISFLLYNANNKYTYFGSNINNNNKNIWDFYTSYTNDIDALYKEYITTTQQLGQRQGQGQGPGQGSGPGPGQGPGPGPGQGPGQGQGQGQGPGPAPAPAQAPVSAPSVEAAARAQAEKLQADEAQAQAQEEGLGQDVGESIESTEDEAIKSIESTGLKLMNMFANAFSNIGGAFSNFMSGKGGLSRYGINKGANQFEEDLEQDNPSKVSEECKKYNKWHWVRGTGGNFTIQFEDSSYDLKIQTFIKNNCTKKNYIVWIFKEINATGLTFFRYLGVPLSLLITALKAYGGLSWGVSSAIALLLSPVVWALNNTPQCFLIVLYYCMAKALDNILIEPVNISNKILTCFLAQAHNGLESVLQEQKISPMLCGPIYSTLNISGDANETVRNILEKHLDNQLKEKFDRTQFYPGGIRGKDKYNYNYYGNYSIADEDEILKNLYLGISKLAGELNESEKELRDKYITEYEEKEGIIDECNFYDNLLKEHPSANFLKIIISRGNPTEFLNFVFCKVFDMPYSDFNMYKFISDINELVGSIYTAGWKLFNAILKILKGEGSGWSGMANEILQAFKDVLLDLWNAILGFALIGKMVIGFIKNGFGIKLLTNFITIIANNMDIRNAFLFYIFGEKTNEEKKRINPIRDIMEDALNELDKDLREGKYNNEVFNKEFFDTGLNFWVGIQQQLIYLYGGLNWIGGEGKPPVKSLDVYLNNYKECNASYSCNNSDLLEKLFNELDEKITFINYRNDTNTRESGLNMTLTNCKDKVEEWKNKSGSEQKEYYKQELSTCLTKLLEALKQYENVEGRKENFYCELKPENDEAPVDADAVRRNAIDVKEKTYGYMGKYTCVEINEQINEYVFETTQILDYIKKSYEINDKVEQMAQNRADDKDISPMSFFVSNVLSIFSNPKSLKETAKNYLIKPCNDSQFLFIDPTIGEPKCIDIVDTGDNIGFAEASESFLKEEKEFFQKDPAFKNLIKEKLRKLLEEELFEDEYVKDAIRKMMSGDNSEDKKRIETIIENVSNEIIKKLVDGENIDNLFEIFINNINSEKIIIGSGDFVLMQKFVEEEKRISVSLRLPVIRGFEEEVIKSKDVVFNNFLKEKLENRDITDTELVVLLLHYNGIAGPYYSDEDLNNVYNLYFKMNLKSKEEVSDLGQDDISPKRIIEEDNTLLNEILGKINNLSDKKEFIEKFRNNLYGILFNTNEINKYYSLAYIIPEKKETQIKINNLKDESIKEFEVKVEGNGEEETSKTREAFKDAFNAPASILKLNDYGIFLNVEDKGLVAGKYINKIQDSNIELPQFKGLKSNGLPPTILYAYKEGEDTELDKFVETYYTKIPKEGENPYYIFKPELKYYNSTFEEFDGEEFVKKLDEYFTKIHYKAKQDNWSAFFHYVNEERRRLGLTDTDMEYINKIRDCITKTKPNPSKNEMNESFEKAIERTGCSVSVSDLGTSKMDYSDYAYDFLGWVVGYESGGKEVGLKINK